MALLFFKAVVRRRSAMSYLRKSIAKFFKKPKVYDVSDLAEKNEITDEIEKVLWELNGKLGLEPNEIKAAVSSLKRRNKSKD